jgi:hydroxylamine reductase
MFCYQCEQTAKGQGCTVHGACGKDPETAALQDLLLYAIAGLSMHAHRARQFDVCDSEADGFVLEALFATLTNVNFDPERLQGLIERACELRERLRKAYEQAAQQAGHSTEPVGGPATFEPADSLRDLVQQGEAVSVDKRIERLGADVAGLEELLLYGLKGAAAYAYHVKEFDSEDETVYAFFHKALDYLTQEDEHTVDSLLGWCLDCGEMNLRAMELLDAAHVSRFGDPEPTEVRVEPVKGKAILVSGHDLLDLEELLKQTQGKGVNVYTHGEMLPAHAYPGLKKYEHLAGNYGGAWQLQKSEFEAFPGAILMTTNCLQQPRETYQARIFTRSVVSWAGVTHVEGRDFAPLIQAAKEAEGFTEEGPDRRIMVGFGHAAVMNAAEQVIRLVKEGKIKHFFLIGGCDGARPGRSYYTELAEAVPDDAVILTLACGKYRFNKLDFGQIEGIPRLLDVGQCNDAYSAIRIAQGLAEAFGTDVNSLPLSLVLSWFEQKAVAILLTLLYLGIKDMRIGPSMPAFLTPAVVSALQEKFNIMPISTPAEDLQAMLG